MASEVRVNTITNRSGLSTVTFGAYGIEFVGITTVEQLNVSSAVTNINATGVSTFAGNIDLNADLDVDGHTELDGVNIAGVLTATSANFSGNVTVLGDLTYENVTNQDSIGIATARSGLRITGGGLDVVGVSTFNDNVKLLDNDKLLLGTGEDLEIYHDGVDNYLDNILGNLYIRNLSDDQDIVLATDGGTGNVITYFRCDGSTGEVQLSHYGTQKLATTSGGIDVTGTVTCDGGDFAGTLTANRLVVDDDGSGSPTVVIKTDDGNPYAFCVKNDTYSTTESIGLLGWQENDGDIFLDAEGNAEYREFHLRQHNGTTPRQLFYAAPDGAVALYHAGSTKLVTTSTGIDVTGSVTCDGGDVAGTLRVNKLIVDDDGQGGAVCRIAGDDGSPWALVVGNDTYSSSENDGLRIYQADAGDITMDIKGNGAYENFNFRNHNGTTSQNCLRITSNREVTLHYQGAQKLITTSAGIDVTGRVESDTLSVGSGLQNGSVASFKGSTQNQINICDSSNTSWGLLLSQSQGNTTASSYHYSTNTGVNKPCAVVNVNSDALHFATGNSARFRLDHNGHVVPTSNNSYDLGSSSLRWRNVYTNDLNLSNEGSANDVDGTWGNYTIQEGEDDLFLINRRSGKKYKFMLQEVN